MRKFETKLVVLIVVVFLATLLLVPIQVLAANEDLQIVKSENGDVIIYVKDLLKTEFKFALVKDNPNEDEMQISYSNSLLDDDTNGGNQVAFIASNELEELAKANSCYLYIKVNDDRRVIELDLNDLFDSSEYKAHLNLIFNAISITQMYGFLSYLTDEERNFFLQCDKLRSDTYRGKRINFLNSGQLSLLFDFDFTNKVFLSAPTSFGKTSLIIEYIISNYSKLKNILFIVPTNSLLEELFSKIIINSKKLKIKSTRHSNFSA